MLTALLLASPPAPSALPAGARAGAGAAVKRQVRVGRVTLTPPRGSEAYPEARGMGVVVARRRACAVGFRAGGRVGSALHSPSAPPPHHSSPPHSAFPSGACPWALVDDGLPNHVLLCCALPAAHPPPPPPSPTPTPATPSTPPATRALTLRLSLATHPPPLPACMPLLLSPTLRFRLHAHAPAAAHVGAGEGVQAGVQGVAAGARREGELRQLLRGGAGVFSFYSLRCNWRWLLRWVDWGECAWGSERGVWGRGGVGCGRLVE
ncbi:unnamed protein product [Closterium sp. Naga37s-1]|nr:unnamed protein product [Closterium sp. Naga37s-1]